ncbi:uncharacterized protein [Aegilops tauschii subsp. strangulata]|uniref:uncharacterized protein isoform X2 n=1 Tax=Aegilops tauschii subsp. strangulata TaxID=200361 RepID=UPI003CC8BA76
MSLFTVYDPSMPLLFCCLSTHIVLYVYMLSMLSEAHVTKMEYGKMRKLTDCIFVGINAIVHVDVIFTRINALVHVDIIDIIFIGTDSSRLLCRAGDAACFELLLLLPTSSPPGGDLDQVGRLSAAVPGAAWEGAAIWTWGCRSEAVPPPASSTSI